MIEENRVIQGLKKDIVVSILLAIIAYAITFALSGFRMYYSTNDDYFIAHSISIGEKSNIFTSYFLTMILSIMQQFLSDVNVFMLSELVLCFCALAVINYVFIKKCSESKIFYIALLTINLAVMPSLSVTLQWTQTTAILATAGYLLILSAFQLADAKNHKVICVVVGAAFLVLASWYRMSGFYAVTLVFAVYLGVEILIYIWREYPQCNSILKAIQKCYKKYIKLILVLSFICLTVLMGNILSNFIKDSSEEYSNFREYNSARSSVIDYGAATYEGNEKFYNELNVFSENDLTVYGSWNVDDDFFTVSKLNDICEYSADPKFGLRFSVEYIFGLFANKMNVLGLDASLVLSIMVIVGIIILVIAFFLKEKVKWIFPSALIIEWVLFGIIFRGQIFNRNCILALPIMAFMVLTGYTFNRYHYFRIVVMSVLLQALTVYFNFTRISYRVIYTFYVPVMVVLLFSISIKDVREKKSLKLQKTGVLAVLCLLISAGIAGFSDFKFEQRGNEENFLKTYIHEQKEQNFVVDFKSMFKLCDNYYRPLKVPNLYDNTLIYAGWYANSPYFNQQKDRMNMKHVFADMIDNESILYVVDDKDFDILLQYFNDHYAEEGSNIEFDVIETIETANICKVKMVNE